MALTDIIVGLAIFGVIMAFILSGSLRALVKAFFNLFVEDMASTPEGAEALYNQKELEVEEKYRKADEVFKKIAGQKKRCETDIVQLKKKLETVESQCEALAKAGDEEGLNIKLAVHSDTIEEIRANTEALTALNAAYNEAKEVREACEENLIRIRKEKKQIVAKMKRDRDMKHIYDDLEGIGANDNTSRLLNRVLEKSNEMSDLVAGSKEAYETKTSTKAKKLDQKLRATETDEYRQKLLNKYKQ